MRLHSESSFLSLFLTLCLTLSAVAVLRFGAESRAVLAGAICGVLAAIPTSLALVRRSRRSGGLARSAGPVDVVVITPHRSVETAMNGGGRGIGKEVERDHWIL